MERDMERNRCRDIFCTDEDSQKSYWKEIIDVLLFLLMDPKDFHNKVAEIFGSLSVLGAVFPLIES